jgi:hypothetical protein
MKVLYEIFVPTLYGDNLKPIRTRHHKNWDKFVQGITGGLTILSSAKGKWVENGVEFPEKIIPVRVMCDETEIPSIGYGSYPNYDKSQIRDIIKFTLKHYRQKAVMYYVVSNDVKIVYADKA